MALSLKQYRDVLKVCSTETLPNLYQGEYAGLHTPCIVLHVCQTFCCMHACAGVNNCIPNHSAEVHEEFHPPPSPPDYTSTMKKDFHRGYYLYAKNWLQCLNSPSQHHISYSKRADFVSTLPPPTKVRHVYLTRLFWHVVMTQSCNLAIVYWSILCPLSQEHNVLTEDPLTFWSDNINSITVCEKFSAHILIFIILYSYEHQGVSQVTCSKAPFHRNAAFSTPIEQYVGQTLPHNISHWTLL